MNLENMINKPSKLSRAWKAVKRYTVAPLVLATGLYAMGCGGGGNNNGENHAPEPINQSSITPANGASYNVGDTLTVGFDCPTDPDGDSLTGTIVVTGDTDGVPGPSAGDFKQEKDLGSLQAGSNYTEDFDTTGWTADSAGTDYTVEIVVSDGEAESSASRDVTLIGEGGNHAPVADFNYAPATPKVGEEVTFTSTSTDADNDSLTCAWDLDGDGQYDDSNNCTANWTFNTAGDHDISLKVSDGTDEDSATETVAVGEAQGPKIPYCEIYTSIVDNSLSMVCPAQNSAGELVFPVEYEVNCPSIPGGCSVESGDVYTNDVFTAAEIGIHDVNVRAKVDGVWTDWYVVHAMVDNVEDEMVIQYEDTGGTPQVMRIKGTQDYMERIASTCFPEFSHANVEAVTSGPDGAYGMERNVPANGQAEVDDIFNCISTASVADSSEAPLLIDYRYAEGRLPEDRLDDIKDSPKTLIQMVFFLGYHN